MNKTAIKNFAVWARNKLISDIKYRAGLMGITAEGIDRPLPQSTGTTQFFNIGTAEPYAINGAAIEQRRRLVEVIEAKAKDSKYETAYNSIMEEGAYTWFNRLIAIRFMEVNDYLPSHIRVLSSESGKAEPDLVTNPFEAELEFSVAENELIFDYQQNNKIDELFCLLFIKQCNALNDILPGLFEKTSDYTELLLNLSVIDRDGVIYHLVNDIPEEDFDITKGGQVEIIGWLYQYYNTEPKSEAFAKSGKITKEEVPAVTQLFTPDWIVRYMVENSLGRIWLEGHPNAELKSTWKYYLDEAEQDEDVKIKLAEIRKDRASISPEDIKLIDPCMGSGHVLVYAFDVLMQIYESVGYSQRDAAKSILQNNIFGLDIDDRAYQLAYFAVMMKARQYNRRILDGSYSCRVYSIHESNNISTSAFKYFEGHLSAEEDKKAKEQLADILYIFKDAKEYGSILKVDTYDWNLLRDFLSEVSYHGQLSLEYVNLDELQNKLLEFIDIAESLAQKYDVTVTNPPYMPPSNCGSKLNDYVKKYYPDSKADMFAVFIEKCGEMLKESGYQAMITMHSWMFLTSFETLRVKITNKPIINMAHLGARAFEEIGGEVVQTTSWIMMRTPIVYYKGIFCRLIEPNTQIGKQKMFLDGFNRYVALQNDFSQIPGSPIAYWINQNLMAAFSKSRLDSFAQTKQGFATGDNERFLRLWHEVSVQNFSENKNCKKRKWFPCNKGGSFRKWYGNNTYLANWENDGAEMRRFSGSVIRNPQFYYQEGITWSSLANQLSLRYSPKNFVFESKGSMCFVNNEKDLPYILGLLNSKIAAEALSILSPTLDFHEGPMLKVPVIMNDNFESIDGTVLSSIQLSKTDWDSFETSWDFQVHPFVRLSKGLWDATAIGASMEFYYGEHKKVDSPLELCYMLWQGECNERFKNLKSNEEKLNRYFIDIYGLQSELSAEVEDKDVSVHKADLQRDIKSFISYAVGCMFGRYSLNCEGLAYAGGEWNSNDYSTYLPDEDNCIPITDEEYFHDDIVGRFVEFVKTVYGEDTLEDNLDFIASALGVKGNTSREVIRNYFVNNFFDDHLKTYQKRPIYWLFDSGKNNGFKALVYLHRIDADTIGNLRVDYLHKLERAYESEMSRMQDTIDNSTIAREVSAATKRKEKLTKQLKECRDYDEKIGHLALSRIELDLDDGVKVNYRKLQTANDGKFYEVLAKSKDIMPKEKK